MKLELTVDEGTALLNGIDTAIKAAGLDCATVLVPIAAKLRAAYSEAEARKAKAAKRRADAPA